MSETKTPETNTPEIKNEITTNEANKPNMRERFVVANEHRDYTIYTKSMDAALEAKAGSIFPFFGEVPEGATIVDIGSGTGKLAELAARNFHSAKVFALDYSHELLEMAGDDRTFIKPVLVTQLNKIFPIILSILHIVRPAVMKLKVLVELTAPRRRLIPCFVNLNPVENWFGEILPNRR